ncbi:MAG: CBS domain-containing protein [Cytophagaceae bacterium]|jgi:predicted transcriptional regulator|nr:CBS domain-containing protein [Cytophagaceae bacterium]
MIAKDLINEMVPPLKPSDSGEKAKRWMEELRLSQLPVVDNNRYVGMLLEDSIYNAGELNRPVSEYKLEYPELFATPSTHYYDIIKMAMRNKLHVLPVINENKEYLGVVSIADTASSIAQMVASQGPGGIMVVSMKEQDYSMAQISRLIESNDTRILSSFAVTDEKNPQYLNLTLKLNKTELSRVVATLERYGYSVIAQFQATELINNDQERLDMLMRYLSI